MSNLVWGGIIPKYKRIAALSPANGISAFHAAGGCLTFSKPMTLRKYINPENYDCSTKFASMGDDCVVMDLWCAVINEELVSESTGSGKHVEGLLAITYLPFHPEHPPEGLFIQYAEAENSSYSGFGDVLEYNDRYWVLKSSIANDVSTTDRQEDQTLYAELELFNFPIVEGAEGLPDELLSYSHYEAADDE